MRKNFCIQNSGKIEIVRFVLSRADDSGRELKLRQADQMLYNRDINVGDVVILDGRQELQRL